MDIIDERPPLPYLTALRAVARCSASTARLLRQHRLRLPARWVVEGSGEREEELF